MGAVDPTFPLYPIGCLLSSLLLLVVLLTSFARQSWNLGVTFLCFWLSLENLASGTNAIIWADNADIKLFAYCDIVTHANLITYIVKPVSTLIIVRRLSVIAGLQTAKIIGSRRKIRLELLLEWMLGLGLPLLVGIVFYYVVQESRFQVYEGFGCQNDEVASVLTLLLIDFWAILIPLVSVIIYYPRVVRTFYRHGKDVNRFLRSNNSVSRTIYFRILILASIDLLFTLPLNLANLVLELSYSIPDGGVPFYPGWHAVHTDWAPRSYYYAGMRAAGIADIVLLYFGLWVSPALGIIIFSLFGLTTEARASYWRVLHTIGGWFGWKPTVRSQSAMGTMEFGERPQDMSLDAEMGTDPSFVNRALADARLENEVNIPKAHTGETVSSDEASPVTGGSSQDVVRRESQDRVE